MKYETLNDIDVKNCDWCGETFAELQEFSYSWKDDDGDIDGETVYICDGCYDTRNEETDPVKMYGDRPH